MKTQKRTRRKRTARKGKSDDMADEKVRAIVIKASDYKDDDKLVKLYTLERGRINAVMRGVKKPKAKLKMCAQVFCFGEYMLSKHGDFYTVTNCVIEETFFSLTADPDKFFAAAAVLELINTSVHDAESNPALFIQILKTMKQFLLPVNPELVQLDFALKLLGVSGYSVRLDKCCACGNTRLKTRCFDMSLSGVVCGECAPVNAVSMSPLCHGILNLVVKTETDRLGTLNFDANGVREALKLAKRLTEYVFG